MKEWYLMNIQIVRTLIHITYVYTHSQPTKPCTAQVAIENIYQLFRKQPGTCSVVAMQ